MEVTGQEQNSAGVRNVVKCFNNLKGFADFDLQPSGDEQLLVDAANHDEQNESDRIPLSPQIPKQGLGLNLGYTINLNLPATSDIAVFNAIFKSLKENLLTDDD